MTPEALANGTPAWFGGCYTMKRDPFESAIDAILASADGDVRRALRAVLVENIALESELRSLYAASEHVRFTDTKNSLH
jgi:hypothetical protein